MTERLSIKPRRAGCAEGVSHHWIIDPPHGRISKGICKCCGKSRRFFNAFEDTISSGDQLQKIGYLTVPRVSAGGLTQVILKT